MFSIFYSKGKVGRAESETQKSPRLCEKGGLEILLRERKEERKKYQELLQRYKRRSVRSLRFLTTIRMCHVLSFFFFVSSFLVPKPSYRQYAIPFSVASVAER